VWGAISAPWLDELDNWLFVAIFPLTLIAMAIAMPLRRTWLDESRQWPKDRPRQFLDEILDPNKTGESFGRWLSRNGHHRVRVFLRVLWLPALFILIWPVVSKGYCSVNKCKGHPAPATVPSK
jgi:hypothetical protein